MQLTALLLSALAAHATAKSIEVKVGQNGLSFSPSTVKANVGDKVNFHFYPGGHSVAQSSYTNPCHPKGKNAIFSGYIAPAIGVDSKMFTVTIKDKNPIWIYCSQVSHCSAGMSMVINPGAGQSLTTYQQKSSGRSATAPSKVQGGKIGPNHP